MTIKTALQKGTSLLKKYSITSAQRDAEVLLAHALNCTKETLYTYPEKNVKTKALLNYFWYIFKRTKQVPVAYITGNKEFYQYDFIVNKHVLIPRPETELLIDCTKQVIKKYKTPVTIADIGTGSGCIAISLIKSSSNIKHCFALDISKNALHVANLNASKHRVHSNITFIQSDLINELPEQHINIIISNPPYLTPEEHISSPTIQKEPIHALTDGVDGLSLYKKLFTQINERLHAPDAILLEIGESQALDVIKLAKKHLIKYSYTPKIYKDLAQKDRVIILTKQH